MNSFCGSSSLPEEIVNLSDPSTGLKGYIAINSTARGPAAGGCRVMRCASDDAALHDALALAQGMTLKNALADLPFGGGKAVINLPSKPFDREALFHSFGRAVERLEGRYVTAEDVGTSVSDMMMVAQKTDFVAGLPAQGSSAGGDPSPWTALGVFLSIQTAFRDRHNRSLSTATVGVQGLGHVGYDLCRRLSEAGAKLIVCDLDERRTDLAQREFDAHPAPVEGFLYREMDVFAPCALGGVLQRADLPKLRADIVCGAANNQLRSPDLAHDLFERNILYAPDYLVNAGGIINVAAEYLGENLGEVEARIRKIPWRLSHVLAEARRERTMPVKISDAIARDAAKRFQSVSFSARSPASAASD